MFGYGIVIGLIIIDLISKNVITSQIRLGERVSVIDGFFWLTNVRNTGAAWSIFESHTWLLTLISWVAAVGMIIYYQKEDLKGIPYLCILMLMAGTIGNGVDRLYLGYVRDFLSFNIFGYMFPVFNLADSLLVVGVILLLIHTLLDKETDHE